MNKGDQIDRVAFAMERLFRINPAGLESYEKKNSVHVNKSFLMPRNKFLLNETLYFWSRSLALFAVITNIVRRNYHWKTYGMILGGFIIGHEVIPSQTYTVFEYSRVTRLRKEAEKYYYYNDGDMSRVAFVMDPRTPISKLRYFSL